MPRPKLKPADKRSHVLVVRATKAERKAMETAAKIAGLSLSVWMRGKLLGL